MTGDVASKLRVAIALAAGGDDWEPLDGRFSQAHVLSAAVVAVRHLTYFLTQATRQLCPACQVTGQRLLLIKPAVALQTEYYGWRCAMGLEPTEAQEQQLFCWQAEARRDCGYLWLNASEEP